MHGFPLGKDFFRVVFKDFAYVVYEYMLIVKENRPRPLGNSELPEPVRKTLEDLF